MCDSDRRLCCRQSAAKHLEQRQWQIAAQLSNCPKQVISDLCRRAQRSIVAGRAAEGGVGQLEGERHAVVALICHRLTAYRLPIESRLAREHHQIKLLKLHWQDAATSISGQQLRSVAVHREQRMEHSAISLS